jgi:hypothetical protein
MSRNPGKGSDVAFDFAQAERVVEIMSFLPCKGRWQPEGLTEGYHRPR